MFLATADKAYALPAEGQHIIRNVKRLQNGAV